MNPNKNIEINESVILIRLNQAYGDDISPQELYDYTRGQWRMSMERAKKATYAFAVYKGQIKEVYKIIKWYRAGETLSYRDNKRIERRANSRITSRIEFIGEIAKEIIRNEYLHKSVKHLFKKGNANPIMYFNC